MSLGPRAALRTRNGRARLMALAARDKAACTGSCRPSQRPSGMPEISLPMGQKDALLVPTRQSGRTDAADRRQG